MRLLSLAFAPSLTLAMSAARSRSPSPEHGEHDEYSDGEEVPADQLVSTAKALYDQGELLVQLSSWTSPESDTCHQLQCAKVRRCLVETRRFCSHRLTLPPRRRLAASARARLSRARRRVPSSRLEDSQDQAPALCVASLTSFCSKCTVRSLFAAPHPQPSPSPNRSGTSSRRSAITFAASARRSSVGPSSRTTLSRSTSTFRAG